MHAKVNFEEFWCWNEKCRNYGAKGKGNIVIKDYKGPEKKLLLRCITCNHSFSETRGTPFFGLKTPKEEVLRALAMLPEKGSIRGVARATGHKPNTICDWVRVAGEQCKKVNDYLLHDLHLNRVQVDEIWSFIKKKRKMSKKMVVRK